MDDYRNNQKKYLRAPTAEEISLALENLGVSARHFERFFNIYPHCLAQCRMKNNIVTVGDKTFFRKLPIKYWHLIFENLPGKKEIVKQVSKSPKPKLKRARRKKVKMDEKILALL